MKTLYTSLLYLSLASLFLIGCSEDTLEDSGQGTITGTVVLEGSNDPIENVRISTTPVSSTVFSDEDGNFIITDVPIGEYSVQAKKDDFVVSFEPASVTNGSTTNVIFELKNDVSDNEPPAAPILVSPADGETEVSLAPTLTWIGSDPDEDELSYTVTLINSITDEVLTTTVVTDTSVVVSELNFNTKYFWQVAANDDIHEPVNSEVSSFTTVASPDNRFLFVRKIGTNNVIFSADDEMSTSIQITSDGQNSWRPRKNNAVQRIAFLRSVGGETHLFTMKDDGSDQTQVTSAIPVTGFNLDEVDFTWEPNGERLFYPNFDKLYAINIDGSGLELIYQTTDGSLITEVDHALFTDVLAVKTNDLDGYNVRIFTMTLTGSVITNVLDGVNGAAGGVNISADGSQILYAYDVSGFENPDYRQLDSRLFIYSGGSASDISGDKPGGTNDLDPRFSPNDASVIYVNTSNDGISQRNLEIISSTGTGSSRTEFIQDAFMPDWE